MRDLDPPAHLDSGDIGQFHVEQHKGRIDFTHEVQGLASGRCFPNFEARLLQDARLRVAERFGIIDVKQNAGSMHGLPHTGRRHFREHPG